MREIPESFDQDSSKIKCVFKDSHAVSIFNDPEVMLKRLPINQSNIQVLQVNCLTYVTELLLSADIKGQSSTILECI